MGDGKGSPKLASGQRGAWPPPGHSCCSAVLHREGCICGTTRPRRGLWAVLGRVGRDGKALSAQGRSEKVLWGVGLRRFSAQGQAWSLEGGACWVCEAGGEGMDSCTKGVIFVVEQ